MNTASGQGLYKIKTIAELTGLNPTLLRAWERRYQLLRPQRTEKGHRLYTADDLRLLSIIKNFIAQGRSIGEVVAVGRDSLLGAKGRDESPPGQKIEPCQSPARNGTSGADLERLSHVVVQAALELDAPVLSKVIGQAFNTGTTAQCVESFILPATREIGRLWKEEKASIAAEHILTSHLSQKINLMIHQQDPPLQGPVALCACFPDEDHELGAMLVAHQLGQLGMAVTYLGPNLPFEDLERAILLKNPDYVFLSATRTATLDIHASRFEALLKRHSQSTVFILGGSAMQSAVAEQLRDLGAQIWDSTRPLSQLTSSVSQPLKT